MEKNKQIINKLFFILKSNLFIISIFLFYILCSLYIAAKISDEFVHNKIFDNYNFTKESLSNSNTFFDITIAVKTDNLMELHIPINVENKNTKITITSTNAKQKFNAKVLPWEDKNIIIISFNPSEKDLKDKYINFQISSDFDIQIYETADNSIIQHKQYGFPLKFKIILFIFIFIVILLFFVILIYMLKRKTKIQNVFLFFFILFGLLNVFVQAPLSHPDEITHYESIYIMSNNLLGIKSDKGTVLKRKCDLNFYPGIYDENNYPTDHTVVIPVKHFFLNMLRNFTLHPDTELISTPQWKTIVKPRIEYFPQACFLTLARLLNFNQFLAYFLMLFGNFFVLSIVLYFAVKKSGDNGILFLLISLSPIYFRTLQTLTYDGIVLAVSLLVISYIYSNFINETLQKKEIIFSIAIALLLFPLKVVYFPISLLLLISIFLKLFINVPFSRKIFYLKVISVSSFVILLILARLDFFKGFSAQNCFSLKYFTQYPIFAIKLFLDTFINGNDWYSFSTALTLHPTKSFFQICSYLLFLIPLNESNELKLNLYQRYSLIIVYFCISFLLFLTAFCWTPYGSPRLWGLQERYFYPILPLFLLFIQSYTQNKYLISKEKQLILIIPILFFNLLNGISI